MTALRLALALAGFAMAATGVVLDSTRVGWAAIALLAASLIVRLLSRRGGPPAP
ncbi:MAG: hypothetical protein H0V43_09790 [Gemmatimonadales bacterium]|nr:hypothetical protein [Gemmatimonadales bacterium]MBA3556004.1 hypothetical protein [Gemmatimonadales bacterium]